MSVIYVRTGRAWQICRRENSQRCYQMCLRMQMAFINASRHLVKVLGVSDMTTALNTMKVINMKNLVLMMMMFNSYARTFTSFNI
jgi:hypothetical protein